MHGSNIFMAWGTHFGDNLDAFHQLPFKSVFMFLHHRPKTKKDRGRGRIPSQEESPLVRVSRELSWPRSRLQRWMSALSLLLSSLPQQPLHSSYCCQQWRQPHYSCSALLKESLDFSSHLLNYFWNFHLSSSHYAVPSPHSRRRGGVFDLSDGAVLVHIRSQNWYLQNHQDINVA